MQPENTHIAQFCMQDFGGAGNTALRLHDGLRAIGANSTFYVHNMQRWKTGSILLNRIARNTAFPDGTRFTAPEWKAFGQHNSRQLAAYPKRPSGLEIFSDTWSATRLLIYPFSVRRPINPANPTPYHLIINTTTTSSARF